MKLDTDLLAQLPAWYRRILDYQELCLAEGEELEALASAITATADNLFFQTMDREAVGQWEKVFHITPDPAAESLAFRRERLLNRIATQPPFTLRFLEKRLDALVGPGKWTVEVDYAGYTLTIETAAYDQSYAQEITATLDRIKPAHIVYVNRPYVADGLLLSHQISLGEAVYHYQLGAWALGELPFASLQDLGVILMPAQPSVQPALLQDTAGFVLEDVAAVRLNGAVTLPGSALTRSQQGSAAFVEYTVSQAQTPAVSRIELLNKDGTALTDAPVYVPVSGDVRFRHKIDVKEGQ